MPQALIKLCKENIIMILSIHDVCILYIFYKRLLYHIMTILVVLILYSCQHLMNGRLPETSYDKLDVDRIRYIQY